MAAKVQNHAARIRGNLRAHTDHFLDHRLQAPTLGPMAHRRIFTQQGQLTEQAQHVLGHASQGQHAIVGSELAQGQPLQIQIRLEFTEKLLMRAMVLIQPDDLGRVEVGRQAGIPEVVLEIGRQQCPAFGVHRPFNQMMDAPVLQFLLRQVVLLFGPPDPDSLATRYAGHARLECPGGGDCL